MIVSKGERTEHAECFPLLLKTRIPKSWLSQGILKGRLVECCSCSSLGQKRGMKAVMRTSIGVKICVTGYECG